MGGTLLTSDLLGTVLGSYDGNPKERTLFVHFSACYVGLTWLMTRICINDLPSLAWGYGAGVVENKIYFLLNNFPHFLNFLQWHVYFLIYLYEIYVYVRKIYPGQVAQLVRASSWYAKVTGSIPSQGICENQQMNTYIRGTINRCFSFSGSNQ